MERLDELRSQYADQLAALCARWRIRELALFGSVLREDFRTGSDIDVPVTFEPNHPWSIVDHLQMEAELSALFGRRVEMTSRMAVESSPNWLRRREILGSARTLYAA
jgi:hypothetical protein